jgi:hypothetical protein
MVLDFPVRENRAASASPAAPFGPEYQGNHGEAGQPGSLTQGAEEWRFGAEVQGENLPALAGRQLPVDIRGQQNAVAFPRRHSLTLSISLPGYFTRNHQAFP